MEKLKLYWKLFTSTFLISAFTIGGGYVIVPLIQKKFVEDLGWMKKDEVVDAVAVSQAAPGPIAVNASMIIGYRVASFPGALVTVAGTVLPPLIIMTIVSFIYTLLISNPIATAILSGVRAGVTAIMVEAVVTLGKSALYKKGAFGWALLPIAFILTFFFDLHPAILIVGGGILGYLHFIFFSRPKSGGGVK